MGKPDHENYHSDCLKCRVQPFEEKLAPDDIIARLLAYSLEG